MDTKKIMKAPVVIEMARDGNHSESERHLAWVALTVRAAVECVPRRVLTVLASALNSSLGHSNSRQAHSTNARTSIVANKLYLRVCALRVCYIYA